MSEGEREKPLEEWTAEDAMQSIGSSVPSHLDAEGKLMPDSVGEEIVSRVQQISIFRPQLQKASHLDDAFEHLMVEEFSEHRGEVKAALTEALNRESLGYTDVPTSIWDWIEE